MRNRCEKVCCFFYILGQTHEAPLREGHKFHDLQSSYPRDASNQNGNNLPCSFQEVKNIKFLMDEDQWQ